MQLWKRPTPRPAAQGQQHSAERAGSLRQLQVARVKPVTFLLQPIAFELLIHWPDYNVDTQTGCDPSKPFATHDQQQATALCKGATDAAHRTPAQAKIRACVLRPAACSCSGWALTGFCLEFSGPLWPSLQQSSSLSDQVQLKGLADLTTAAMQGSQSGVPKIKADGTSTARASPEAGRPQGAVRVVHAGFRTGGDGCLRMLAQSKQ